MKKLFIYILKAALTQYEIMGGTTGSGEPYYCIRHTFPTLIINGEKWTCRDNLFFLNKETIVEGSLEAVNGK